MIVTVTGGKKAQQEYVKSVVEFCQKKLMPRMTNIDVDVRLRYFPKNEENCGYCMAVDGPRPDRPREFEIEVHAGMRLRKLLETVCHEMVHVKQYAQSELYESGQTGMHRWHGEWIKNDPDYWDCPWEWEAMGRETALFVQWAEKEGLGKEKWARDS